MNPHDELMLEAYLDGVLNPMQARRVEMHLSQCAHCRELLEERRMLSNILDEAPAATLRKTQERFVAEINLRMARHPEERLPRASFILGWHLIPVGLLAGMLFIQVALWMATLFEFIPGAQALLANLPVANTGAALALPPSLDVVIRLVGPFNQWTMSMLAGLALLLLAALMYLGWLASWFARGKATA